jgi:hypothetical protein
VKLKSIVEGLNEKIHFNHNQLGNHKDPKHKTLLNIISNISECVSKKFDSINKKFFDFANPYKRSLDKEIATISSSGDEKLQK